MKLSKMGAEALKRVRLEAERDKDWRLARLCTLELWSRAGEPMKGRQAS